MIPVDLSAKSTGRCVTLQFSTLSEKSFGWLFRIRVEEAVRITYVLTRSKANMTSTKTRAVVYLSYGLVHVMKLSHMLNV